MSVAMSRKRGSTGGFTQVDDRLAAGFHAVQKVAELVEEQLVAVKVFPARGFGDLAVLIVSGGGERRQIHQDFSAIADDFTSATGGALDVVLLQVDGQRATAELKFHQGAGGVFDVDFEMAPMSAESEQAARHSEERVEVVEFVDLGDQDAAAEVGAGSVHLAIVLVGMPAGKILADVRTHSQQIAESALAHRALQGEETGMETKLVADHDDAAVRFDRLQKLGEAVQIVGDGLFEEQIAAGAHTGEGGSDVKAGRVADEGDVRLLGERGIQTVEDANTVNLLDVAALVGLEGGGHHVREPPDAPGQDLDAVAEKGTQVAQVALADAAQTHHQDFHRALPESEKCASSRRRTR